MTTMTKSKVVNLFRIEDALFYPSLQNIVLHL